MRASFAEADWNRRNGDDRRCRSRYTRGSPSLHAGCDAALFRFLVGCVANHEVHVSEAGLLESAMPRRDGAQSLPPDLSAL
jgi:hypothetical protein